MADREAARPAGPEQEAIFERELTGFVCDFNAAVSRQDVFLNSRSLPGLYLAGEHRVARHLAGALRHPRSTVRRGAAKLCEALEDPQCLGSFEGMDAGSPIETGAATYRLFCRLGSAPHLPIIEEALGHHQEPICLAAIAALKRLRPATAVSLLLASALKDRPLVCVSALTAIGELGDPGQIPLLLETLNSDRSFHRIGAARGLSALAIRCPEGDFTAVMEVLQKRARLGGVEYRQALETVRKAIGIDPELPIPAGGGRLSAESLPIPDERRKVAPFQPERASPLPDARFEDEGEEDASLARRLNNMLPHPDTWEYD